MIDDDEDEGDDNTSPQTPPVTTPPQPDPLFDDMGEKVPLTGAASPPAYSN